MWEFIQRSTQKSVIGFELIQPSPQPYNVLVGHSVRFGACKTSGPLKPIQWGGSHAPLHYSLFRVSKITGQAYLAAKIVLLEKFSGLTVLGLLSIISTSLSSATLLFVDHIKFYKDHVPVL